MSKTPVIVSMPQWKEILERYLDAEGGINYALKVLGHPGIGKSDAVRQTARKRNFLFLDTRLAFKENIDLGGYPVPDHDARRMIYYRPAFIPPETVPDGCNGILWFLDEANRAHPTVIQTLFQIITERVCGEHPLPDGTFIVLAGNLGEQDETAVTEFDDSALDGRLAVFHLKPDAANWLAWARQEGIHPAVVSYITLFPDKLWDEARIHPNPRGWHQVSQALTSSYRLATEEALAAHLAAGHGSTLEKVVAALVGPVAAAEFLESVAAPRPLTVRQVLAGDAEGLAAVGRGDVRLEDVLWALSGALQALRERRIAGGPGPDPALLAPLAGTLQYIGSVRADLRVSFFYQLLRQCALFTQIPAALAQLEDRDLADRLGTTFADMLESP